MTGFVLVHGAWSDNAAWDAVAARPRSAGHQVAAPDLPAHGGDRTPAPQASLNAYADTTAKAAAVSAPGGWQPPGGWRPATCRCCLTRKGWLPPCSN